MSVFIGTTITCDSCGEHEYRVATNYRAVAKGRAKRAGWVERNHYGESQDICPVCVAAEAAEVVETREEAR